MGVSYKNCEFERDASFVLTQDRFGLGSLTRTYQGREDKLQEFLKKWPVGKADEVLPQFKLTAVSAQGAGALSTATLSFVGLLNGELPKETKSGGWARQTATLKKLEGDQTVEIEYMAPTATYTYVSKKLPLSPKYKGKLLTPDVPWEVRNLRGDRSTKFWECRLIADVGGTQIYSKTQAGRFNYVRVVALDSFTFDQSGDFYLCTEVCVGSIIEPQRNDLPRFLNPDNFAGQTLG